jgi:hypothetical protein
VGLTSFSKKSPCPKSNEKDSLQALPLTVRSDPDPLHID